MERPTSEADKFAQRFMHVKCVEMVKAFRGHTSVIEYCLQNEIGADFKNPATVEILAAMRAEDPSRCIVLNDGFVAEPRKAAQAWYAPWDDKLHRSRGADGGTSTRVRATSGTTSSMCRRISLRMRCPRGRYSRA
jgi:beta-galactosidase